MTTFDGSEDIERAELYRLFAGFFAKEPDDNMLRHMADVFQMDINELPSEIRADFSQIFASTGNLLMPYESMHIYPFGDSPRLWGRATEEVQKFYNSAGLMIDLQITPAPDHISAELLFMSYLVEQGLADEQKKFMEKHLLQWIPEFCDKVIGYAVTTFCREAAGLLKEFILSEHNLLGND